MNIPNCMKPTPVPTNYMNLTSEYDPNTDPELDQNEPLTQDPNENGYVENPELIVYLRSFI